MKAGKGMSSDFMLEIGSGSLARLMSEWAHNKSWAETQADEVESLRRQLAAMRRGLQQLLGAPELPPLSDAELFTMLGEALDRAVDDRHVEYSRPGGPVELTVDVSALRVEPRSHVIPLGEPFGGLSPWLAPPQDTERPRPDHVDDQLTYAKMLERGEVDETAFPEAGDSGTPTESMPPVEEPPAVHGLTGEVLTDGDNPNDMREWPSWMATRSGDVYQYQATRDDGQPEYHCFAMMATHTLAELLTMHGTLWVVDANAGAAAGEQVSGE